MTGLPDVSLNIPAPCPGDLAGHPVPPAPYRRPPARPADSPARSDAWPVPGDTPPDAHSDARHDARGDAHRGVLVVPDSLPAAPRVPWWLRAWLTGRHWGAAWWQSAERLITSPRGPWHAQPESLADHDAYRRSRAWVPPGHPGRILGPSGGAYHRTLGNFGMTAGYSLAWIFARPMRLVITAAVLGVVLGFWLG